MQWILDNWLLLLLGGGMVAMHLFGHGHGGHGGHGQRRDDAAPPGPKLRPGAPADQAKRGRDA